MKEKFLGIPNAQKRSLSLKERFSFFLFIGKFILSKFGLFLVFVVLHFSSRYSQSFSPIRLSGNSSAGFLTQAAEVYVVNEVSELQGLDSKTPNFCQNKASLNNSEKNSILTIEVFQKIRNYCIIGTIVTLFLNPQQTKYFGGLAVVLKQVGFFTKYSKSEKTVYVFSWIFVILFFCFSIQIASIARSSKVLLL